MTGISELDPNAARGLRHDLKGALTAFASGRGSVESLLHQVERIARYATGKPKMALGPARKHMKRLVRCSAPALIDNTGLPGVGWDELYSAVVEGRNDLAHTGTEAALVGTRVATLATVLLAALAEAAEEKGIGKVKDVMVSNPVFAHGWQTLADLRRTMLVNDFSVLPLSVDQPNQCLWECVRAEELADFLADHPGATGCTLASALDGGRNTPMRVYRARIVREDQEKGKLLGRDAPDLPVVVGRTVGQRCEVVWDRDSVRSAVTHEEELRMTQGTLYKAAYPFQDDVLALPVEDIDRAAEWYGEKLGLREVERRQSPVPTVIMERDGTRIGFAVNGGDASQDGAAILVDGIAEARDELEAKGVSVGNWRVDERDDGKYQVFFVVAPDGLCFYFHAPLE